MTVKVIAELGVSHLGNVDTAIKLIHAAADAGCWGVKLQVREPLASYSKEKLDSYYESPFGTTYREWAYAREFEPMTHQYLMEYAHKKNLKYGFSVWDSISSSNYSELHPDFVKVPSARIRDIDLVSAILVDYPCSQFHFSTGGCELKDIDRVVDILPITKAVLYHCIMSYPMSPTDACLSLIELYEMRYKERCFIGYSDHSSGIHVPFASAMLGAKYIEKHVCLDRAAWGPDNASSLEPDMLKRMVRNINQIADIIGDGVKRVRECEQKDYARLVINR